MNLVVVLAIIAQSAVSRINRLISAVMGYVITTGILLWGVGVYSDDGAIAFFGIIELSLEIFLILCLVWYIVDTFELISALLERARIRRTLKDPIMNEETVVGFYQNTQQAWRSGALNQLGPRFQKEANKEYNQFIKKYLPYEDSALHVFFKQYSPLDGEYLVGVGNLNNDIPPGWFVLTNFRLVQRNGKDNEYKEVVFSDVDSYRLNPTARTMVFTMESGEEVSIESMKMYPQGRFITAVTGKQLLVTK